MIRFFLTCALSATIFVATASAQTAVTNRHGFSKVAHGTGNFMKNAFLPNENWHPTQGQRLRFWTSLAALATANTVAAVRANQNGRISGSRIAAGVSLGFFGGMVSSAFYKTNHPDFAVVENLGLAAEYGVLAYRLGPPPNQH